jgi:ubiquinone/menaquinone biosynthesis C-methylase UbiE
MNNQQAYDNWAKTYDAVSNPTRDVEARALRSLLAPVECANALEIGCGTGKNTAWLAERAGHLIGADFSAEMLAQARAKIASPKIEFTQIDAREAWRFASAQFDLVTCSLILEHIDDIGFVFQEAGRVLQPGGRFYVGEFHPFKQYLGRKARFATGNGVFELECFTHHVSDFVAAAEKGGLVCERLTEWFDEDDRSNIPRILAMIFRKSET